MHLNLLKGNYGTIRQIDKSLPVKSGEEGIVRGSLLFNQAGEFRKAASADNDQVYLSLHAQDEPDVLMTKNLTALPVNAATGEVETDMFKTDDVYAIGDKLTIGEGVAKKLTAPLTETVIGTVTKVPTVRWSNNVRKGNAMRTGGTITVIQFAPEFDRAEGDK